MNDSSDTTSNGAVGILSCAFASVMVWLGFFHEALRFYSFELSPGLGSVQSQGYIMCMAIAFGFGLGLVFALALGKRVGLRKLTFVGAGGFCCAVVAGLLPYWMIAIHASATLFIAALFALAVAAAAPVALCIRSAFFLSPPAFLLFACIEVLFCAALAPSVYNLAALNLPLLFVAVLHFAFGLLSLAFLARALLPATSAQPRTPDGGGHFDKVGALEVARARILPPLPLVVHLVAFGMGFGVIHTLVGDNFFGFDAFTRQIPITLGALAAIALTLPLRRSFHIEELWRRSRTTVFMPAMAGLILLSAMSSYYLPVTLVETGNSSYDILILLGCYCAAAETKASKVAAATVGLALKNLGFAVGAGIGYVAVSYIGTSHQVVLWMTFLSFMLFAVGSFWLGNDHELRHWWGLRHEMTPKRFLDEDTQAKCRWLADAFDLSKREQEVLVLLVQRKKRQEIADALFISPYTVRSHVQSIYGKLDIHDVGGLARILEDTPGLRG